MSIGTTIRKLRLKRYLTQHELAVASGVSRATIAVLETEARSNAGLETIERLAAALGVSSAELLTKVSRR